LYFFILVITNMKILLKLNSLGEFFSLLGYINKCDNCPAKATVRVEWDDSIDGIDWFCSNCFKDRYVCNTHRDRALESNYV
jgi:hypothetical protein